MRNWFIVEFSSRGQLFVMIGTSIAFSTCGPYNRIREEGDMRVIFVCDLSSALLLATPIKMILDQCCWRGLDIKYIYFSFEIIYLTLCFLLWYFCL